VPNLRAPIQLQSNLDALLVQCSPYDWLESAIAVVDAQGRLQYANQAFVRFNARLRDSIANLGASATLLECPEFHTWLVNSLNTAQTNSLHHTFYYAPLIPVELTLCLTRIVTPDNKIAGALLTLGEESIEFDQRHLARKQDAYRTLVERIKVLDTQKFETQNLLRVLLKDAPVAMVLLNAKREILQLNHAATQLFETSITEIRGQTCERILPCFGECNACPAQESQRSIKNEEILTVVGDKTLSLLRSVAVLQGADTMIAEAFVDVSERKATQEKYHSIIQTARDGFWIVGKDGRLLEVNAAYCRMSGYSRAELLNMHVMDLEAQESVEEIQQHIQKIIAQGSDRFESQQRHKDGGLIDVEVSVQYMSSGESQFVVFVKDITDRKQHEMRLEKARQEAESANKAKSEFLSVMSHELRTPLNAILGFGQLLEEDPVCSLPDQQQSIQHILMAGHSLLGLVTDILDLSSIDVGKFVPKLESVGIAEIASTCVSQVTAALAEKKNITIENFVTDTTLQVRADRMRLQQVLINLLSNAVKYNKAHGRVTIRSQIDIDGGLRIQVSDTGIGIPDHQQSLLFNPFERLDQKHGAISGVGIGLHISKRLLEAMQGSIGVESAQGEGSCFWFVLPLVEKTLVSTEAPEKIKHASLQVDPDFVVLYIEDNPENTLLVKKALHAKFDVDLLTADSAEKGLRIASEKLPGLILMDIQLPGMDGYAATKTLKENLTTKNIPIVALSANAIQKDIDHAMHCGCNAYLTKPIELQALYAVIEQFAGQHSGNKESQ